MKGSTNYLSQVITTVVAVGALAISIFTFSITYKLFVGQNTPLIDVTPTSVITNKNFTATTFSVTNYSGFPAFNIGIDLKYADAWIVEWVKAQEDARGKSEGQKIIVDGRPYLSSPRLSQGRITIDKLGSGETINKDSQNRPLSITGDFDLQKNVCPQDGKEPSKSHSIWIRVTWQNEKGHTFDELHKYALVCTLCRDEKDKVGYSFTFVPEGIISRKDAK